MEKRRIVVTGVGVLASNGIGREAFWDAIFEGVSGIKPISLFDASGFKAKTAGEIRDFQPQEFLGDKGLRTLDRSTKLVCSATKLALGDSGFEVTEDNTHDCGVAIGSTLGSIWSVSEFEREAIKEGVRYVNPAFFPNTVINSPASQVSIKFNIKGFNATISTGFTAGLNAIQYGADLLRSGKAKIVIAGGVEELCIQTYLGFYKAGCLSGTKEGALELSCPFDKRRNGVILGEGAAVVVLEDLDSALKRKAKIYAELRGYSANFGPNDEALTKNIILSMRCADIKEGDIDYICSTANSSVDIDAIEAQAIKNVFAKIAGDIPISSVKSMVGECFSASGSLALVAALGAIERQMVPPTINYQEKDERCDLNYIVNQAKGFKIRNVLIDSCGFSGCNSSLIVSFFNN